MLAHLFLLRSYLWANGGVWYMFLLLFAHGKALFEGLLNRCIFFDILFLISVLNDICYTKTYGLDIALAIFCGIFYNIECR